MVAVCQVAGMSGASAISIGRSASWVGRSHTRDFASDFNGILPSHVNIVSSVRRSVSYESTPPYHELPTLCCIPHTRILFVRIHSVAMVIFACYPDACAPPPFSAPLSRAKRLSLRPCIPRGVPLSHAPPR